MSRGSWNHLYIDGAPEADDIPLCQNPRCQHAINPRAIPRYKSPPLDGALIPHAGGAAPLGRLIAIG